MSTESVLRLIAELANEAEYSDDLIVTVVDADGNEHSASVEVNSPARRVELTVTCEDVCAVSERTALQERIEELEAEE